MIASDHCAGNGEGKSPPVFGLERDNTEYRKLDTAQINTDQFRDQKITVIPGSALVDLAREGFGDINHFLRSEHLEQLRTILTDDDASENDKYVAFDLLKNAGIAADGILPMCQDTGTAIVVGSMGNRIWLEGSSAYRDIETGIRQAYAERNLRYSHLAPLSMFEEQNTRTNLPAQIDLHTSDHCPDEFNFLLIAKGGGSANKSMLYQCTPALLDPEKLNAFLREKIASIGTAACPPYHLAIVIGGLSAEMTMKTVKLASCHQLDSLPDQASPASLSYRDKSLENDVLTMTTQLGIGAQFGGKYFCHDVRVIRLPRHGASLPIGIGVSCAADRQAKAKISPAGVYLEALERDPSRFLPSPSIASSSPAIPVNLDQPMANILTQLNPHPIKTRLALSGPLIVARDAAHLRIRRKLAEGKPMPGYFKDHPIYYAGPAKKPEGLTSGSFGPTTAGRMDSFVDQFQALGGSMVMLAKGNRSEVVRRACARHGGFYLGSVGGAAARLAKECIRKVECIDFEELGMEAVWRIEVINFPAFIIIDFRGNDFFSRYSADTT